jgi:hypothetical protein
MRMAVDGFIVRIFGVGRPLNTRANGVNNEKVEIAAEKALELMSESASQACFVQLFASCMTTVRLCGTSGTVATVPT